MTTAWDPHLLGSLAGGLKDEVIAREMNVAVRTVGRRIKKLMQKFRVETRFQAGLQAARKGLIGADQ